jgi:hypothetical protein
VNEGELICLPFENRLANGRLSRQPASAGGILLDAFWKGLAEWFWDQAGLSPHSPHLISEKFR